MVKSPSALLNLMLIPALLGCPQTPMMDISTSAVNVTSEEALASTAYFSRRPERFASRTSAFVIRQGIGNVLESIQTHRRGFVQWCIVGATAACAALAQEVRAAWPAFPAWNVRPTLTPVPIPADIETLINTLITQAHGDLSAAATNAGDIISTPVSPDDHERALIAEVLILIRFITTSDPAYGPALRNRLRILLTGPQGSMLVNHRDLLNQGYRVILGPGYDEFRLRYRYEPINPTADQNGVSDLANLDQMLPQLLGPAKEQSTVYVRALQDAGFHFSLRMLLQPAQWAQEEPLGGPIFSTAIKLGQALGFERFVTAAALQKIPDLASLSEKVTLATLLTPEATRLAQHMDHVFETGPVQVDELQTWLIYKGTPAFEEIVTHAPRYLRYFLSIQGNPISSVLSLIQTPTFVEVAKVLDEKYNYTFDADDRSSLQQIQSVQDFETLLTRARAIFGADVPINGDLLFSLDSLRNLSPGALDFLIQLHRETGGPSPRVVLPWIGFATNFANETTFNGGPRDTIWTTIRELKALGWQPTREQPAYLENWARTPQAMATVRRLVAAGWTVHNLQNFFFYMTLSANPSLVDRLSRLPPSSSPALYLADYAPFLAELFPQTNLFDAFIGLHERGLAFDGSELTQENLNPTAMRSVLQQVANEVAAHGWTTLENLQRYATMSVWSFLLHLPVGASAQTSPLFRRILMMDVGAWLAPDMQAALKNLSTRIGYRLSIGEKEKDVLALSADTERLKNAELLYHQLPLPMNQERLIFLRDPHLQALFQNPATQTVLALLGAKGYVFRVRDTEFLYHLGQKPQWLEFIQAQRIISPDLYEIKRAYFREQLEHPAFQNAIREMLALDLANPYTEFGGIIGFSEQGDLVLFPLPSNHAPIKDYFRNTSHEIRSFDADNLTWFNGRYFSEFHNHAIGGDTVLARPSIADRRTNEGRSAWLDLSVLFAASPGASGKIVAAIYAQGRMGEISGELHWTGSTVYGTNPVKPNDTPPVYTYPDEPFLYPKRPSMALRASV